MIIIWEECRPIHEIIESILDGVQNNVTEHALIFVWSHRSRQTCVGVHVTLSRGDNDNDHLSCQLSVPKARKNLSMISCADFVTLGTESARACCWSRSTTAKLNQNSPRNSFPFSAWLKTMLCERITESSSHTCPSCIQKRAGIVPESTSIRVVRPESFLRCEGARTLGLSLSSPRARSGGDLMNSTRVEFCLPVNSRNTAGRINSPRV